MDQRGFDEWVRWFVEAKGTRRFGLRLLVSSAVAAGLGRHGWGATTTVAASRCVSLGKSCGHGRACCAGRCRRGKCRCPRDQTANNGACILREPCTGDGDCSGGKVCTNGLCKCPPGWGDCLGWGICGPMDSNPYWCGSCDRRCAEGESCVEGRCVR